MRTFAAQKRLWILLSLVLFGCAQTQPTPAPKAQESHPASQPDQESPVPKVMSLAPFEGSWELPRIQDLDASATRLEVNLEAKPTEIEYLPGKKAQVWAYNGTVPGPLLEANIGDEVTVHFKNSLPEPTTIHWHGIRLPATMDGSPVMQNPVPPGGTFEYRFTFQDAGLYWFHPHFRSDKQVEKGLYGVILVRDPNEPNFNAKEQILVLDDVLLNDAGDLDRFIPAGDMVMGGPESQPASQHAHHAEDSLRYSCPMHPNVTSDRPGTCHICSMTLLPESEGHHGMSADDMVGMIGRHGNVLLVNGKPRPSITLRAGERQRWRMVNTANSRYFRLSLPGHKFTLIGTDGGLLEAPREVEELLLAPGERADVLVTGTGNPGDVLDLMTLPYARGHGLGHELPAELLRVRYANEPRVETSPLPTSLRVIEPLTTEGAKTKTLRLSESMGVGGVRFYINNESYPKVTELVSKLGETEVWEVFNDSEMDHPFHLHGFFFQVIDRNGVPESYKAWKDTVNLPGNERLRFAVKFEGFSGRWMYHCHILEHGERGMMGELVVEP